MVTQLTENLNTDTAINLVPVIRTLPADLETPVSVFLKLSGKGPSFLLESITGGEQLARYSFIGVDPSYAYILQDGVLSRNTIRQGQIVNSEMMSGDPFEVLRQELSNHHYRTQPGLPRFPGGLVGYLGYQLVHYIEPSVPPGRNSEFPEAIYFVADTFVAFDHAYGQLHLITHMREDPEEDQSIRVSCAQMRLDALEERLSFPLDPDLAGTPRLADKNLRTNVSKSEFVSAVRRAKEHISAGDAFQIVLSQRISRETFASPFSIYRALRRLNPSPYMFFFNFSGLVKGPDLHLIGASPEMHVRLQGSTATMRPIAGTRPRGRTPEEDFLYESSLLADDKECAEHIMLVDLARNDLGRVCHYGSVCVPELMGVERYSHVMHIVSQVEGDLQPEYDAFDLMKATFPAGTVTGAPKVRAMQIIRDLEGTPRGPYAGAVGYFGYDGSMDTCITIRTLEMRGNTVSVQAGAGIVADSDPEKEYQETLNKARALAEAVELAEQDQETNRRLIGAQDDRSNR